VSINVTVTQPTGAGLVSLVPGACTPPTLGTLNFAVNQTRANNAVLALAADGSGTLSANAAIAGNGTVHLLIDVDGYFQ
jgi:hypothetical protein